MRQLKHNVQHDIIVHEERKFSVQHEVIVQHEQVVQQRVRVEVIVQRDQVVRLHVEHENGVVHEQRNRVVVLKYLQNVMERVRVVHVQLRVLHDNIV